MRLVYGDEIPDTAPRRIPLDEEHELFRRQDWRIVEQQVHMIQHHLHRKITQLIFFVVSSISSLKHRLDWVSR